MDPSALSLRREGRNAPPEHRLEAQPDPLCQLRRECRLADAAHADDANQSALIGQEPLRQRFVLVDPSRSISSRLRELGAGESRAVLDIMVVRDAKPDPTRNYCPKLDV